MGEAAVTGESTGWGGERGHGETRGGFVPVLVGGRDADWAGPGAGLPVDVLGARICALATRMAQATA